MKEFVKKFIPQWFLNLYHFILAFLGALVYLFSSKKLKVIGVTGTNGKTTVVEMITKILEEAGYRVASLNSIKFKISDREWQNTLRMTMPGRFFIQKFLRQAVNENCQYAVLEVTSEGIKQYRHAFINFEVAVFTNLTPEHIEAHGSFEKYRQIKGKIFRATKRVHVINLDDENAEYFLQFPAEKKINFSFNVANFSKIKEHYIAFITQQLSQMEALQSEIAIHSKLIEELKSTVSFEIARLKVRLEEVNKIEKDYNVE